MSGRKRTLPPAARSLSAGLLVLAVAFVMLAEVLIYTPSIARFRKVYLEEHLADGHLAILALQATPERMVSQSLADELLNHTEAHNIVLRDPASGRKLMLMRASPPAPDATFDLRRGTFMSLIADALVALAQRENRVLRVIGPSPKNPQVEIELLLDETPLRQQMYGYSRRILGLSIVISLITATLLYLTLQALFVRPMRRITASMTAFEENPEDDSGVIAPSRRRDEIGVAQRRLAEMQAALRAALKQRQRLAALGAAVGKINHDLRNALGTMQLVSDGLAKSDDPHVRKLVPRLMGAVDRAVRLCSQTLEFTREGPPPIRRERFALKALVDEVGAQLTEPLLPGLAPQNQTGLINAVDAGLDVDADREQLFRVLSNLGRNAMEAGAAHVTVSAGRADDGTLIDVEDDGPGLTDQARERLFQPFSGSTRKGGTGLGLPIARDVMRAHGGDITLIETGKHGTRFRLTLPNRSAA
ncbi:MAG: sensor histidine kinase [Kiloniellales bacterium]